MSKTIKIGPYQSIADICCENNRHFEKTENKKGIVTSWRTLVIILARHVLSSVGTSME